MKKLTQLLVSALLMAAAAQAGVIITFDQPSQTALPGDLLIFSGSIQNTGMDEIFLNSDSPGFTGDNVNFTFEDNFFVNVPVSLAGGQTASGINLFQILVSPSFAASFGTYTGNYVLIGGADGEAQDVLANAEFGVTVDAGVPEPATTTLVGCAALMLIARRSLRRRRA